MLKENLPPHLTYHCWQHTRYVISMAKRIATAERLNEHEIFLVKVAALYHDHGFLEQGEGHEMKSIEYCKSKLPEYGFPDKDINTIIGMIKATEIPQNPTNILEKVLADADLEYLGTDRFKEVGDLLYTELKHSNPDFTYDAWNEIQIKFMKSHYYHTEYCLQHRKDKKEENLQNLIRQVSK